MSLSLPLKARSRLGFYHSFSETTEQPETLEDIFRQLEESQRTRSRSESAAVIVCFDPEVIKRWSVERSLGNGASGHVDLMRDSSGNRYAVKKMRLTGRREANRQIVRDLEFLLRAVQSLPDEHIVMFHGYARRTFEAWIVMEVMDSCFGKLLSRTSAGLPEDVIGALVASVVKALHHLKTQHKMIHRDVRPTNILVDRNGFIKLCDFGISRVLVNSLANTVDAGNKYYLAPERVLSSRSNYGIKSDVWSLGVTLVELASGRNPYADCPGEFAAAEMICRGPAPCLPDSFSEEARFFVAQCLRKDEEKRPNYDDLMRMSFYRKYEHADRQVVGTWVRQVLADEI